MASNVTETECEDRRKDIYNQTRVNGIALAEMKGGIRVLIFVVPAMIAALGFWMDNKIGKITEEIKSMRQPWRTSTTYPSIDDTTDINEVLPVVTLPKPPSLKEESAESKK